MLTSQVQNKTPVAADIWRIASGENIAYVPHSFGFNNSVRGTRGWFAGLRDASHRMASWHHAGRDTLPK
jgi:hypothetical protein